MRTATDFFQKELFFRFIFLTLILLSSSQSSLRAEDCGIRGYDGMNIIKFDCQPAGATTSPLQVRIPPTLLNPQGEVRGIVLVDETATNKSKFRVSVPNGTGGTLIKALGIVANPTLDATAIGICIYAPSGCFSNDCDGKSYTGVLRTWPPSFDSPWVEINQWASTVIGYCQSKGFTGAYTSPVIGTPGTITGASMYWHCLNGPSTSPDGWYAGPCSYPGQSCTAICGSHGLHSTADPLYNSSLVFFSYGSPLCSGGVQSAPTVVFGGGGWYCSVPTRVQTYVCGCYCSS